MLQLRFLFVSFYAWIHDAILNVIRRPDWIRWKWNDGGFNGAQESHNQMDIVWRHMYVHVKSVLWRKPLVRSMQFRFADPSFVSRRELRIPERHPRAPSNLFPLSFQCPSTYPSVQLLRPCIDEREVSYAT